MCLTLTLLTLVITGLVTIGGPRAYADSEYGAFGTVQLNAGDWMAANGGGVTVYSNGDTSYVSGDYSAPAVGMKWQCVELTQRLYQAKGRHSGFWSGVSYAYQIYDNAAANGLQARTNGSYVPVPGDMIIHSPSGNFVAGHVAVVDRVAGNKVYAVEQNVAMSGQSSAGRATYTITNGVLSRDQSIGLPIRGLAHDPDNPNSNGSNTTNARMMGDVNGDGKADAVVMFGDTGTAMVALANPAQSKFDTPSSWASGQFPNDKYFLADANGDGKADLVAFDPNTGDWWVSLSTGTGFGPYPQQWAAGQGQGTTRQWVARVNSDARDDTVTFDAATGDWYVSLSTGTGFGPYQQLWAHGHGVGSNDQAVADFSGDGRADLGVYFSSNGSWYVATTGDVPPFGYSQWSYGHGMNSNFRYVGNVNGTAGADVCYFFTSGGIWDCGMAASNGQGFFAPTRWAIDQGAESTDRFLADVTGDGRADEITFTRSDGSWKVDTSSGTGFYGPPQTWITGHGTNS